MNDLTDERNVLRGDYMEDFNIILKQEDGTELVVNTSMIEEDVLRMRCGLKPKEQD